ncbi:shikimate kinase [Geoglobus acetivorans]|uniref:Shikimate kinase n=1 Tax=Geoglobus acetivorans TaxID=565033 RepID=A0A0A7GGA8_GEOAI|nr:Shikimate kinase II [Geoglobus acetivorans]
MKVKSKSYAAGTVINALATFKGVAFGIDLETRVVFSETDDRGFYISRKGRLERSAIAEKLMRSSEFEGGVFRVESEIPERSGLGSSSAFMNALLLASLKAKERELDAGKILRLNARMSLEFGMSYTGAFDDASASLLGGFVFSDNMRMKLYRRVELEGEVLVLLPEWQRGDVKPDMMKEGTENVERAFNLAMEGKYREAMLLNSMHYCPKLNLPLEPVYALQSLNVSVGLSGNGPSYVAFGEDIDAAEEIWGSFGKVMRKRIVNEPSDRVDIPENLFY